MTDIVIFFISQSVIIVGSILLTYVRTQVAIAKLEENVDAIRVDTRELKNDHGGLSAQVTGISISLARLEGHVKAKDGESRSSVSSS